MAKISIIIPCFFNEENIPLLKERLLSNENNFSKDTEFEYVFVDDGSKDNTLAELIKFKEEKPDKVKVIKLSGNFGSYNAILAGMSKATGDCNVVISADLQDPPELISKMYEYWLKGIKLVLANREKREDNYLQRLFSNTYHYLIRKFAIKNMPKGGFDFVLFDKKLKDEILKINERNTNQLFLLTWLKYDYVTIPYIRKKRETGKSRWTTSKKVKLFIDSFVSFSFFPIRLISFIGLFLGMISLLYGLFVVICRVFGIIHLEGWAAIMAVLLFVSAFQMISIGILGEYVWRALDAARNRPNYIIEEIY